MVWEDLLRRPFCIYGAGIVATSVYTAFRILYNRTPLFFLISDTVAPGIESKPGTKLEKKQECDRTGLHGNNPREIDGIPVKTFSEWEGECCRNKRQNQKAASDGFDKKNPDVYIYIVAAPEMHHAAILEMLKKLSVRDENIYLITDETENDLMEKFCSSLSGCDTVRNIIDRARQQSCHARDSRLAGFEGQINIDSWISSGNRVNSNSLTDIHVYQAKSHKDRPLQKKWSALAWPSYIDPIQVGAALTGQRIAELRDNIGDNISAKNSNYCELTATYYAWKHKSIC